MSTHFDDLDDDLSNAGAIPSKHQAERFTCPACRGTGRYLGIRTQQTESKCFRCSGRGWHQTDPVKAKASRVKAAQTKANNLGNKVAAWIVANFDLHARMVQEREWHGFSADMLSNLTKWGSLTEGQVGALKRAYDSIDAKRAERDKAKVANSGAVDISRIVELFATASAAGLKRPKFRAEGLTVSKAPDTGRNAGALYVTTTGDTYLGKIADGRFQATGAAAADTLAKLVVIAADPKAAAVAYGRLTGACGCCGRELTDAVSVAAGIGPICESKWGL